MLTIILSLFSSARQGFQTRAALQAEILALRHQLLVLQRSSRGHRLRLSRADRFLWVWLARFWSGWRSALVIGKPETITTPQTSTPGWISSPCSNSAPRIHGGGTGLWRARFQRGGD